MLPNLLAHHLVFQLKNKLDDVVCKWIFHEYLCLPCNAKHKALLLGFVSRIYALLHNAATMLMASYLDNILFEVIVDELLILWGPCTQNLLNNMIAIDVMCQRYEVFDQIFAQLCLMFLKFEHLDNFLD